MVERAPLRAPGGVELRVMIGQLVRQQQHGQPLVGVLAALGLHLHADAGGEMDGAHRRFRLVHMLPTRSGRTRGLEADLAWQRFRRRLAARHAEEPVLAGMARAIGARARPLDRADPALRDGVFGIALQADQRRAQRAGVCPVLLFQDFEPHPSLG